MSTTTVRPVTKGLVQAMCMDEWPSMAGVVDFGLASKEHYEVLRYGFGLVSRKHYEALYYGIRAGTITPEMLDHALGNGPRLTALARADQHNPHKQIVFTTAYDKM